MNKGSRRHGTGLALAFLAAGAVVSAAPQGDVRTLALSAPATVLELDLDKLEGEPSRLSWSGNGLQLYVRTTEVDLWGNERSWHHVIQLAPPALVSAGEEPAWAAVYWAGKSALAAPGVPGFRVDLESRQERTTATGVQGSLAPAMDPTRGAELGPQGAAIVSSALQAQMVTRSTLKLKGSLIGEFINTPPRMGLTFGWGPSGSGVVAYVDAKKHLGLMDQAGRHQQVAGVKDAHLPAWSRDGRRLAYLEKTAKKRWALRIIDVSSRVP